jgi:hypothetical protein
MSPLTANIKENFVPEFQGSHADLLRLGTETALGRANFLRTTKIETLQSFVMYLVSFDVQCAESILSTYLDPPLQVRAFPSTFSSPWCSHKNG